MKSENSSSVEARKAHARSRKEHQSPSIFLVMSRDERRKIMLCASLVFVLGVRRIPLRQSVSEVVSIQGL